jgi:hypothetical protein
VDDESVTGRAWDRGADAVLAERRLVAACTMADCNLLVVVVD